MRLEFVSTAPRESMMTHTSEETINVYTYSITHHGFNSYSAVIASFIYIQRFAKWRGDVVQAHEQETSAR